MSVERIIKKYYKLVDDQVVCTTGFMKCKTEIILLKNMRYLSLSKKPSFKTLPIRMQIAKRDKLNQKIDNEVDFYFLIENSYNWSRGNDNLKTLLKK